MTFIFGIQLHLDNIEVKFEYQAQGQGQIKKYILYKTFPSVCLYFIETYLNGQGHSKVKVNGHRI